METKSKRNILPFNGEKYAVWKFRIRALLNELNVLHCVDSEDQPIENDDFVNDDSVAKNTIIEYLHDNQLGVADIETTSRQIFQKLDEIYERKSIATQLAIRKQLLSLKLNPDETLIKHFVRYDELISQLISAGGKMEEADKISHLLLTLPKIYDSVITAIETLLEDNMTLSFVKVRLLDHEVKLKADSADTSTKVLHVIQKRSISRFNSNNKNNFKRNKIIKCHYCKRNGHIKKNCFKFLNKNNNGGMRQNDNEQKSVQSAQADKNYVFMMTNEIFNCTEFILDSGASDHIVNDDKFFDVYEDLNPVINIATAKIGSTITATKRGRINVVSNLEKQCAIRNVLYCKDVPNNLLSVGKLQQSGLEVRFDHLGASIWCKNEKIAEGKLKNFLYIIKFNIENRNVNVASTRKDINLRIWHERLGHIGKNKLIEIANKNMAVDSELLNNLKPENKICEACINGKQARLPLNEKKNKDFVKRPLFIVHSDVCGPIKPTSINNRNYFVNFIDEFTHYTTTYVLTNKSEVFNAFKDYAKKSEAHFNFKIVHLYCDNGGEYLSNDMKDFCVSQGISYHLTVPYTPQLNGVSERMNRTICEKARAMLNGCKLSKEFWCEAVLSATYLINMSPTRALMQNKTPYEMWHNKKPTLRFLRIFGSTVYVHNKVIKTKFDEKSWKGILTGYAPNGYKVWDPVNEKIVVVRDVIIDEFDYLASRPDLSSEDTSDDISQSSKRLKNDTVISDENESIVHNKEGGELRRSERIKLRQEPVMLGNVCALNVIYDPPERYEEIKGRSDEKEWQKAVQEELNSLLENQTWQIVEKPHDKNIVDCKWVFTIKNDEHGNPVRYKARLVAKGFSQEYLTDYNETFAPVARMTSFRIMCAFANENNLLLHQMDVKTAFLNGILKEEIYMRIPEGVSGGSNKACKLKKALYGLKQAARCWFELFEQVLIEKGFRTSSADRCVYVLDNGEISKNIYVILYVDDVVIATASMNTMKNFKAFLMNKFKMVDMHELKFFLGIQVEKFQDRICLNQSAYIKKVIEKFNMKDCNPVSTPLPTKINYQALNESGDCNYPCRNLVGCLMYIMLCTRPDLSAAVGILSRFSNRNNKELWQGLKRILRYLKGTLNLKLTYKKIEYENVISGFVDSDWGSNDVDRTSTTGYLFKMYDMCSISWVTRKQNSVAASSTEAEYMALFEATREAKWLKSFIDEIGVIFEDPIVIHEDNNGCISIASNPSSHKRSKHIDIKYHFTREQVEKKLIKLASISTDNQTADAMTKSLPVVKFDIHRMQMGLE